MQSNFERLCWLGAWLGAVSIDFTYLHDFVHQIICFLDDPYWCSVKIAGQKRFTREVIGDTAWTENISLLVYHLYADKVNTEINVGYISPNSDWALDL